MTSSQSLEGTQPLSTESVSAKHRSRIGEREMSDTLAFLSANPMSARGKVAAYLGIEPVRMGLLLKRLCQQGKVVQTGAKKGAKYSVAR